jgi:hypothetical protein
MKDSIEKNIDPFLQECIFSIFGYPIEIAMNQGHPDLLKKS